MKQFYWMNLLAVALLPLFLLSCEKEKPEETRLTVTPDGTISLKWDASDAPLRVAVSSNESWNFLSSTPWLKVEQDAEGLMLTPETNDTEAIRKAQILIRAGELTKTITVEQEGRGIYFDLQSELSVPYYGIETTLYVSSNNDQWSVSCDADWVTIHSEPIYQKLQISIPPNSLETERVAQLTLSYATKSKTLTIRQDGFQGYILPFFEWGSDIASILAKEQGRKSVLTQTPTAPLPPISSGHPYYDFETLSPLFPIVKYKTIDLSDQMVHVAVLEAKDAEVVKSEAFEKFMADAGYQLDDSFTSISGGVYKAYRNESNKSIAQVVTQKNPATVTFYPIVEQSKEQPTIDKFYFFDDHLVFGESDADAVKAYEKESGGGKYDGTFSISLTYQLEQRIELFHTPDPFFSRWYYFDDDNKLVDVMYMCTSFEVGLYTYASLKFVTNEFHQLLVDNGFERRGALDDPELGHFYYDNEEKQIRLICADINWNGQRVFRYHVYSLK